MNRPLLLDLYCGAGGASKGYYDAGFDVVGVDIEPQPRYPYEFIQYDAKQFLLDYDLSVFSAFHASPPCQRYSALNYIHQNDYPDDIMPIRRLLSQLEKPYVIENVPLSPLRDPITLCGLSFGLNTIKHRLFESNIPLYSPPHIRHHKLKTGFEKVYGTGNYNIKQGRQAMGIDWMVKIELSQAIPPAYTHYIGSQLMNVIRQRDNVESNILNRRCR